MGSSVLFHRFVLLCLPFLPCILETPLAPFHSTTCLYLIFLDTGSQQSAGIPTQRVKPEMNPPMQQFYDPAQGFTSNAGMEQMTGNQAPSTQAFYGSAQGLVQTERMTGYQAPSTQAFYGLAQGSGQNAGQATGGQAPGAPTMQTANIPAEGVPGNKKRINGQSLSTMPVGGSSQGPPGNKRRRIVGHPTPEKPVVKFRQTVPERVQPTTNQPSVLSTAPSGMQPTMIDELAMKRLKVIEIGFELDVIEARILSQLRHLEAATAMANTTPNGQATHNQVANQKQVNRDMDEIQKTLAGLYGEWGGVMVEWVRCSRLARRM